MHSDQSSHDTVQIGASIAFLLCSRQSKGGVVCTLHGFEAFVSQSRWSLAVCLSVPKIYVLDFSSRELACFLLDMLLIRVGRLFLPPLPQAV